jgi:hypothetical protein
VTWRGSPDRRSPRSQFLIVPIQLRPTERVNPALHRPMQALVEWPLGRSQPRAFWLTDLVGRPVEELVHLAKLNWRSRLSLTELTDRFGLCDYEGRSFPGWHHHVTLASAAYVYQLSKSLRSERRTLASA